MHLEGPIRAVNLLIRDFLANEHSFGSRTAKFAYSKLAAKFEEPQADASNARRKAAWEKWISFDEALQTKEILGPHWAKARLIIHECLSDFRLGELTFTNGSSFVPLGPKTSIACKLTEQWTITPDCFDVFAKYSYWHRALKHAAKKRFKSYCATHRLSERGLNKKLWMRYSTCRDAAFQIYKFKLYFVVTFVGGNRWSTVPKNNLKDRSICLEPLCNMLVQRAVGLGIRRSLKDFFGIDLDNLADVHRRRISDQSVATIDLSDCSDAVSMRLINYLLPKRAKHFVLASRSDMTLGPDDMFYFVKKVSSMGNGFTFDLMTLVLTALTRSLDANATVFGDDIICQNSVADAVVDNLRVAGFVVNLDKTYINSDYRESCGSHYIDGKGYVTVFDLKWLANPHDLVVACNKVAILSSIYGGPFDSLRAGIWSCIPKSLLGATVVRPTVYTGRPPAYALDTYIRYGPTFVVKPTRNVTRTMRKFCANTQRNGAFSVAVAFVNRNLPARDHLRSTDWDLFYQYVHSARLTRRIPKVTLKSTLVARVGEEQIGFTNTLLPVRG